MPPLPSRASRASADQDLADLLADAARRLQAGETVDVGDYAALCPEHVARLEQLLPAMRTLADLGHTGSALSFSAAGPVGPDTEAQGKLGDFCILREIGRGGMGVVYEAEQMSLHRRVALKMLPFATVLDARQLQRFQNEAVAAASLKHPNIVQVYSVGCERGIHYYAMEYVEGQTLAEVIRQLRENRTADGGQRSEVGDQRAEDRGQKSEDSGRRSDSPLPPAGEGPGVRGTARGTDPTVTLFHSPPLPLSPSPSPSASPFPALPPAPDTKPEPQAAVSTKRPHAAAEHFRTVATWGIQAAEALEHAHQMGVVHRDIKPSNLLIDAKGQLLVTDFGLAQTQTGANLTMTGDILGTLRYMSPEQAQGNRQILDHRSDIYSLGVTLYELLALRPAFQSQDRHVLLHEIVDSDPPSLREVNPSIPRDLETIVSKAIAAEPQARYAAAQEMADDLRRFLEHKPIRARRPSLMDHAAKWAHRHQPAVLSALAAMTLALVGLAVSTVLITGAYRREQEQHTAADQQRTRAEDRESDLRHYLYAADLKLAHQAWKNAELPRALELLSRHSPGPHETDLRGFEWHYLWALCQKDQPTLAGHMGEVYCLAFSPDGKTLASASQDGTVKLWDVATEQLRRTLKAQAAEVNHVAFSPDGATLAATGDDGMVKLWEVATGREKAVLKGHAKDVFGIAFSPDGRLLATGGCDADKAVKLWNAKTLREEAILRGHTGDVQSLAFAPDGKTLASASSDEKLKLWDVASRKERATIDGHAKLTCVAFSRDGRKIATASQDRTVRLWHLADLNESRCFQGHTNWVHCIAFSPDGSLLASASRDGSVRIWGATGELVNVLRGHTGRVWCAAFSPDGKTLATAAGDRTIKLWDPTARQDCQRGPASAAGIRAIGFTSDGMLLVSAGEVFLWDPESSPEARKARWIPEATASAAFSPDRRTLATGNMGGGVKLWNAVNGELQADLGRHGAAPGISPIGLVVFSADGRMLATYCDADGTVKAWDVLARRASRTLGFEKAISSLTLGPDGRTLVVALYNGIVKLIDAQSGQERGTLHGGEDEGIRCLAFSPDGATLAAAGDDRVIRLWDMATASQRQVLVGHSDWIEALAFAPDGKTLASGGRDGTVRFWSPVSGRELLAVDTPVGIQHLVFSRDGKRLAGGGTLVGRGGELCLWSAAAGIPEKPQAAKEKTERAK